MSKFRNIAELNICKMQTQQIKGEIIVTDKDSQQNNMGPPLQKKRKTLHQLYI